MTSPSPHAIPRTDNAESLRISRLLHGIVLFTLGGLLLHAAFRAVFEPVNASRWIGFTLALSAWNAVVFLVNHRAHPRTASILYLLGIWCVVTVAVITGGGTDAAAMSGYFSVVLAAGLLLREPGGIISAVICAITGVGIALAEMWRMLPEASVVQTPLTMIATNMLMLFLMLAAVYLYTRGISISAETARRTGANMRRAETALSESEERAEIFSRTALEGIAISLEGRLVEVNEQLAQMTGWTREEMLGRDLLDFAAAESHGLILEKVQAGDTHPYEAVALTKNGTRVPVELCGKPVQYRGRAARVSVIRDLTDRKRMEESLKTREALLRHVIEFQTEFIVRWLPDGTRTFVNAAYAKFFNLTPEECIGTNFFHLIPEKDRESVRRKIASITTASPVAWDEHPTFLPDGSVGWTEWTDRGIFDDNGTLIELQSVGRDVTQKKRNALALEASERKFRELLESAPDAMVIVDESGRITLVNGQAERIFGWKRDELLGQTVEMLIPERFRPGHVELRGRYLADPGIRGMGVGRELLALRKDGTEFPVEVSLSPLETETGRLVSGSIRDITDRKRAEEALRESEERFQHAFEDAAIGIALVSPEGKWIKVNQALCEMTGYDEAELLSKTFQDITHPDDLQADLAFVRQMLAGEIKTYRMEKRYIHKSGREVWILLAVSLVRDAHGGPLYFLSQITDINSRKLAEKDRERAQRMLGERVKELALLHRVAQVLQSDHLSETELLQAVAEMLPQGWQYPSVTVARIAFDGIEFQSPGFERTPWMQRAEFRSLDGKIGVIEIAYTKQRPPEDEGPFFVEERNLLITIAETIRAHLDRRQARRHIQRQLDHITVLHNIDSAILTSLEVRVALDVVLEQVTQRIGADAADILLVNPGTPWLEFASGRGLRAAESEKIVERMGEGFAGSVGLSRRLLHIPNLADSDIEGKRREAMLKEGFVAYCGIPLIAKGNLKGVMEVFHRSPMDFDAEWKSLLTTVAGQTAIALDNFDMFDGLQRSHMELALAYDATIEGWSRALDLRDKETEGHSQRVTDKTVELATAMGVPGSDIVNIRRGALLHDIGKMGIPDAILLKPDKLTDEEWVIMRKHPVYAYELLHPIHYLRPALDIPHYHHEKWDGSGYPHGLKGEQIPLAARIFAVVDVWDALKSDRPYRAGWPLEKVLAHIKEGSGTHFDPEVVKTFMRLA